MATLLLVPGAMHGAWCFERLVPRLEARGHRVETMTLRGLGERRAELSPTIGLAHHVDDVVAVLEQRDLTDTVLVPHSYGGVVADMASERSDRVAGLVRLDAFVVHDGESLMDCEPAATQAFYHRWADEQGDGWRLPPDDAFLDQWGVTEPDLRNVVRAQLTDFPLACITDAATMPSERGAGLTLGAIWNTDPPLAGLAQSRARAAQAMWPAVEIPAGHDSMLSHPEAVAVAIDSFLA